MPRTAGVTLLALLAAAPLAAQDGSTWSADRPDGVARVGLEGARTLPRGAIELSTGWTVRRAEGTWFDGDTIAESTTLQLYDVAPRKRSERRHWLRAEFGLTNRLTIGASGGYVFLTRDQATDKLPALADLVLYRTTAAALDDLTADATFNVLMSGSYRLDVNVGLSIPVGANTTHDRTPFGDELLPYDMRPGSGSWGLSGRLSFDNQSDRTSFGGRVGILAYVTEAPEGYTQGNEYEARAWIAHDPWELVSLTLGGRLEQWGAIDGADHRLDVAHDPYTDPLFLSGRRVSLPLGVSLLGPEGTRAEGHSLSIEAAYALRHDYEGLQLGVRWTVDVRYAVLF